MTDILYRIINLSKIDGIHLIVGKKMSTLSTIKYFDVILCEYTGRHDPKNKTQDNYGRLI